MEFRTYQAVGSLMKIGTIKEKQSATPYMYKSTGNKPTLTKRVAHLQTISKLNWIKLFRLWLALAIWQKKIKMPWEELKFFQSSIFLYYFPYNV